VSVTGLAAVETTVVVRYDGSPRAQAQLRESWARAARAGRPVEVRLEVGRGLTWALALGCGCTNVEETLTEIHHQLREQAYAGAAALAAEQQLVWSLTCPRRARR
jgi:hydroxypyruvate isomerase